MKFSVGVTLENEQENEPNLGKEIASTPDKPRMLNDNIEDLVEYAKCSKNPIFILDENCRILYKNRYVNRIAPKLEKGEKINRFLPEGASYYIGLMEDRRILRTEFSKDEFRCSSAVVSVGDFNVVVLDYLGAELSEAVEEAIGRMSGYDVEIPIPAGIKGIRNFDFRAAEELLTEALERYKTTRPIPFFKSTDILKKLFESLKKKDSEIFERVKLRFSGEEYISSGSERDFVLTAACLISFCVAASKDGCAEVEVVGGDGFSNIYVSSNCCLTEKSRFDFSNLKYARDIKNEETGWLYLLKILSGTNLWELTSDTETEGRLGFMLRLAVADGFDGLELRDVEKDYLENIVARVFGLVFA